MPRPRRRPRPRVPAARAIVALAIAVSALAGCASGTGDPVASPSASAGQSAPPTLPVDANELAKLRGPWSPTPIELSPAAVDVVDQFCRTLVGDELDGYELAVVDARGQSFVNVFYVGTTAGHRSCELLSVNPFGELEAISHGGSPDAPIPMPGATTVEWWLGSGYENPFWLTVEAGRAGSAIAEVRYTSEDQPPIVASMRNGWYALWFPDGWPRLTLRGYDADGIEVFAATEW